MPHLGDFVVSRETDALYLVISVTSGGHLRVRSYDRETRSRGAMQFYAGRYEVLTVNDPRHPHFRPCRPDTLAELGL